MGFWASLPVIGGIVKTIFGDRSARDQQSHENQMAVQQQFAAEFGHSKTVWDSFIDGVNRLPRPVMTFGMIALFWYCVTDPDGFERSAQALRSMPHEGWTLLWMVTAFWFGTKAIEKIPSKFGMLQRPVKKHTSNAPENTPPNPRVDVSKPASSDWDHVND